MREIKYRAWVKNNKHMVRVHSLHLNTKKAIISNFKIGGNYAIDFNDIILMEYTGLKDINNREVYEGDIDELGYIVSYSNGMNENAGLNVGWYLQKNDWQSYIELTNDIKIIGNIYEI